MKLTVIPLILGMLVLGGCVHPISKNLRQSAEPGLTPQKLFENPLAHKGQQVILGGVIVATRNYPEVSEIEVVQKELDWGGYPQRDDRSQGRFLFVLPGYLESEIYSKGRRIVGAGTVEQTKKGKVDERPYVFPVIKAKELHLFEDKRRAFSPPYWDPFYRPHFYSPLHRRHPFLW